MKKIDFSNKLVQWSTLALLSIVWGSSFILMKRGLESYTPPEITSYRLFIVSVVLLPIIFKHRSEIFGPKKWAYLAVGMLGSAIPYFLFVVSQTHISSSLSGVLNSSTPLFTLLFGSIFFKMKFMTKSIFGILLGFVGVLGLIWFAKGGLSSDGNLSIYAILPVIASACYGMNVNIIKRYLQEINPEVVTALSFALVGPLAGLYLFANTDFVSHTLHSEQGWASLGYISILGIVGTALAVLLFNVFIKETSALFASSVTYLIPIVAIVWGIIDGESFNWQQAICMLLVLIAVSLVNSKKKVRQ